MPSGSALRASNGRLLGGHQHTQLRHLFLERGDAPILAKDVLVWRTYILWESNAIGQYLAGKKPESGLLPVGEKAHLDVTRWQFWDLAHWDPTCAVYIFENVVKPIITKSGQPDPAAIADGAELFHRTAKVLDGQLKRNKFITGERLTLADFSIGSAMNLADLAHFPIEPYGEIIRWYGALRSLPACRGRSHNASYRPQ